MNDNFQKNIKKLIELVGAKSKHSDYQLLHPILAKISPSLSFTYDPKGKSETSRQAFMSKHLSLAGLSVLDIGANTGYFSMAAIDEGAKWVVSQEGNIEHAEFISLSAICLDIKDRIEVRASYFDFSSETVEPQRFDLALCLNVLHHLGDDFGDNELTLDAAKKEMLEALNRLSNAADKCWMQLGFNWKGDRNRPLFPNGTKTEIIDFVQRGTQGHWDIERIAVFDPISRAYEEANSINLARFDELGEFLNRPLFLLRSHQNLS